MLHDGRLSLSQDDPQDAENAKAMRHNPRSFPEDFAMPAHTLLVVAGAAISLALTSPLAAQTSIALPPIKTVTCDEHGAFRVNDKPFFPIALYDAPHDDATLAELRAFGFNVLSCDAKASTTLRAKGFYGATHADTKMDDLSGVFVGVGMDSPALNLKQDLLRQTREYNAKTQADIPGRPVMNAIGYWEDEPQGVITGRLPSKAVYEDLVAAIDVSAPYLYPVPYQPVSSVGDAVARARNATSGRKALLPVLQLFTWDPKERYPTPAELRCMVFLALVEGAHGIGYYSYRTVITHPGSTIAATQPELWKSVKPLNHDLAEIAPQLLAGKPSTELALGEGAADVKLRVVRSDSGLLAVVVNTSSNAKSAKLVSKSEPVDRLQRRSGGQLEFRDGLATLPLEPFGVEILRQP
jgi:hypothetical protein